MGCGEFQESLIQFGDVLAFLFDVIYSGETSLRLRLDPVCVQFFTERRCGQLSPYYLPPIMRDGDWLFIDADLGFGAALPGPRCLTGRCA
jgi:hypothetical protein